MERINPEKVEKAVRLFVKQYGLEEGFKKHRIYETFNALAGENICRYVKSKSLVGRKLFVYFSSAIARNELYMVRSDLANKINEKYGEFVVEEIILK